MENRGSAGISILGYLFCSVIKNLSPLYVSGVLSSFPIYLEGKMNLLSFMSILYSPGSVLNPYLPLLSVLHFLTSRNLLRLNLYKQTIASGIGSLVMGLKTVPQNLFGFAINSRGSADNSLALVLDNNRTEARTRPALAIKSDPDTRVAKISGKSGEAIMVLCAYELLGTENISNTKTNRHKFNCFLLLTPLL